MRKQSDGMRYVISVFSSAALAGALVACGNPTAPGSSGPSSQTQASPPPAPAVTITGISRNSGSTGGGASVTMFGTGFTSVVTVTFGGIDVRGVFDQRYPEYIILETPAHPAGAVDVVMTNRDGQSDRLSGGYTYVSPDSLDLNGRWIGATSDGSDRAMGFTIQNNNLTSVTCFGGVSGAATVTVATMSAVSNGAFAVTGNDAISVSGRIVSAGEVIGTMTMGDCTSMAWRAYPAKPAAGGVASR